MIRQSTRTEAKLSQQLHFIVNFVRSGFEMAP